MVDIGKQVAYWRRGAVEDWEVASHLLERGNTRHGFFFVHLAVEKALKALICRNTDDLAPKDHNLLRLAGNAGLVLTPKQRKVLHVLNSYNIEGRYPSSLPPLPRGSEISRTLKRAEETFLWLIGQ